MVIYPPGFFWGIYLPTEKRKVLKAEDQILEVIKKYLLGKSTREEFRETISLFMDPEQTGKIESQLKEIWESESYHIAPEYESKNLNFILDNIHNYIDPELRKIRFLRIRRTIQNISKIAAVLVVGIILGFFIYTMRTSAPPTFTSFAPKGSISQMILPDNTMVYLNSASKISYTHKRSGKKREVVLDGEAWFHVAENSKKPFIVHTSAYDIKVTGTKFNVKAYRDEKEIVTTLVSGSVTISSTENFRMKAEKILQPGQQLIYNRDAKTVTTKSVQTKFYTSWRENKLIFINMSLEDLVILLERKYGVDINVDDSSILKYHYDGTLKNETILEVLELIKVTLPIQYEIVGQEIHITKKKETKR